MSYIFYKISPPPNEGDPVNWAHLYADWYGFDYDIGKTRAANTIIAWPVYDDKELAEALELDYITFSTFEINDLDTFLGL